MRLHFYWPTVLLVSTITRSFLTAWFASIALITADMNRRGKAGWRYGLAVLVYFPLGLGVWSYARSKLPARAGIALGPIVLAAAACGFLIGGVSGMLMGHRPDFR